MGSKASARWVPLACAGALVAGAVLKATRARRREAAVRRCCGDGGAERRRGRGGSVDALLESSSPDHTQNSLTSDASLEEVEARFFLFFVVLCRGSVCSRRVI
jgi:hypothetical protein